MILEEQLFAHHKGRSVLLDSNLLLVLLIGSFDPKLFDRFKRVSDYTTEDYDLLVRLLGSFRILLTTPHIFTEVSNLANSLPERVKLDWFQSFAALLGSQTNTPGLRERWMSAETLAAMPEFSAFGITDAALSTLASEALIITEDRRLSGRLKQQGTPVLNFGDLRKLERFL
jgi:hypothetical protein